MAKQQKKEVKNPKVTVKAEPKKFDEEEEDRDEFDFGGLPKNVSLKRNIGCGG